MTFVLRKEAPPNFTQKSSKKGWGRHDSCSERRKPQMLLRADFLEATFLYLRAGICLRYLPSTLCSGFSSPVQSTPVSSATEELTSKAQSL